MTGGNLSDRKHLSRKAWSEVSIALHEEENHFYLSCGDEYVVADKGFYQIAFVWRTRVQYVLIQDAHASNEQKLISR